MAMDDGADFALIVLEEHPRALTVGDLVGAPHLRLDLLAEGDLGRTVRWVHATDQPDPAPYLRGGEVVLTDGLWLAGGTTPARYVERLAAAAVAAIGFGLVEGGTPPPTALVRACRRRAVTLFAVPVDVPFLAISELFVERVVAEREEPLRRTLGRSERLLAAISEPDGASRVLEQLREELGAEAWLADAGGALLAGAGAPPAGPVARFPIRRPGGGEAQLCLARARDDLDVGAQTAIQQAVAVLAIDLAHREALRQTQRRFAVELFDLARDAEAEAPAIARRLRALGLDPAGALVGIACETPAAEERLDAFEGALAAVGLQAVASARGGRLLAVAQGAPDPAEGRELATRIARATGADTAVGVGMPVAGSALLDATLADARRACRLARLRQDARGGASAGELATHAGLLAQQDPELLEHFWRALLGPLLEHDAARGSELVWTLEAFLGSGGRYAQTAERLHVHVNTLRHRLGRVEQLTGRRAEDPDDRVDLHLALRARAASAG